MKNLKLGEILPIIGGKIIWGDADLIINNVAVYQYNVRQNSLFFNQLGRTVQTYNIKKKFAFITEKNIEITAESNITVVQVEDVNESYWNFINYYRSLFNLPVIGITGTCGKTTTKEMIKHILKEDYKVQSTYLSENTLPLNIYYLSGIEDDTQIAVFEMGVSYPKNLLTSCMCFQPNIGVITTIGVDHLAGCRTMENYIKAKSEMLEGMNYKGTLIINADSENISKIDFSNFKGEIVKFGIYKKAEFMASKITYSAKGGMEFTVTFRDEDYTFFLPVYGEHQVYNALAAVAALHFAGIDIAKAKERFATFEAVKSHLQILEGLNGSTVIDDTWSMNPTSLEPALKVLKELSKDKRSIAVLGCFEDLLDLTTESYSKAAELINQLGIDTLIIAVDEAKEIGINAIEKGMAKDKVFFCKRTEEVPAVLKPMLDKNSVLLLKKSMKNSFMKILKEIAN